MKTNTLSHRLTAILIMATMFLGFGTMHAQTYYNGEFPVTFVTSKPNIDAADWVTYPAGSTAARTGNNLCAGTPADTTVPNLSSLERVVNFYLSSCGTATFTIRGNASRKTAFWIDNVLVDSSQIAANSCDELVFEVNKSSNCIVSVSGVSGSVYLHQAVFTAGGGGQVDLINTDLSDMMTEKGGSTLVNIHSNPTGYVNGGVITLKGARYNDTSNLSEVTGMTITKDDMKNRTVNCIRFGSASDVTTAAGGVVPGSNYLKIKPDNAYVNGGHLKIKGSSNSNNMGFIILNMRNGDVFDSVNMGAPSKVIHEFDIELPADFGKTAGDELGIIRAGSSASFLWSIQLTTEGDGGNVVNYSALRINEVNATSTKYVEIYNTSDKEIPLEGVTLLQGSDVKWTGAESDKIAAKGFFSVDVTSLSNTDALAVTLKAPAVEEVSETLDTYKKSLAATGLYAFLADKVHARIPDGTGDWYYTTTASKGVANAAEPATDDIKFGLEDDHVALQNNEVLTLSFDSKPYANNGPAETFRTSTDGNVMFGKIGTTGTFDYIQADNNNENFVLNTPSAGAFVVLSKDKAITRLKITFSANGTANPATPYLAFSSNNTEESYVGSETPFDNDLGCAQKYTVVGTTAEEHTWICPAGTQSVFIARANSTCDTDETPKNTTSFRITNIEIYTDGGVADVPWVNYSKLRINEVNGTGEDAEKYVELYNGGSKNVPLKDVTLHYNGNLTWTGGEGDVLLAKDTISSHYFVVQGANASYPGMSEELSANNADVTLEMKDPEGNSLDLYSKPLDVNIGANWGDYDNLNNKAHARIPDGTGAWFFTLDNVGTKDSTNGSNTKGFTEFGREDDPVALDEAPNAMLVLSSADITTKFNGITTDNQPIQTLKTSEDGLVRIGVANIQPGDRSTSGNMVGIGDSEEAVGYYFQLGQSNANLALNPAITDNPASNDAMVIQSKGKPIGRIKIWISNNGDSEIRPMVYYNSDTSDASYVGYDGNFVNEKCAYEEFGTKGSIAQLTTYTCPPETQSVMFVRQATGASTMCEGVTSIQQTFRIYRIEVYDIDQDACDMITLSVDSKYLRVKESPDTTRGEFPVGTFIGDMGVVFTTSPDATVKANGNTVTSPYNQLFTSPVEYVVTSPNGEHSKTYIVHVWAKQGVTGIEEPQVEVLATVYPNPATTVLNVEGANLSQVEILDMLGHRVLVKKTTGTSEQINVSALKEGLYFVRILTHAGETSTIKFLKK